MTQPNFGFVVQSALSNEGYKIEDWPIEMGFIISSSTSEFRESLVRELYRAQKNFFGDEFTEYAPEWEDDESLKTLNQNLSQYDQTPLMHCFPELELVIREYSYLERIYVEVKGIPTLIAMLIANKEVETNRESAEYPVLPDHIG